MPSFSQFPLTAGQSIYFTVVRRENSDHCGDRGQDSTVGGHHRRLQRQHLSGDDDGLHGRGLVEFYAKQRIERSIVTSFGYLIQEIAAIVGGDRVEKISGNADIIYTADGVETYIEIKSGTVSSNKKMMREMSRQHDAVKESDPDAITTLGLIYGKDEDVSGIMRGYDDDEILVGKDFWESLSDNLEAYVDVIEVITQARENVKDRRRGDSYSLQELLERQFDSLVDDWCAEYSRQIDYKNIQQFYF